MGGSLEERKMLQEHEPWASVSTAFLKKSKGESLSRKRISARGANCAGDKINKYDGKAERKTERNPKREGDFRVI